MKYHWMLSQRKGQLTDFTNKIEKNLVRAGKFGKLPSLEKQKWRKLRKMTIQKKRAKLKNCLGTPEICCRHLPSKL
jgi:hypothetical protein